MSRGRRGECKGQNMKFRRKQPLMDSFTFIGSDLKMLNTHVFFNETGRNYRRARMLQLKQKQIQRCQEIAQLGNFRQVASSPALPFISSIDRIHVLLLALLPPQRTCVRSTGGSHIGKNFQKV